VAELDQHRHEREAGRRRYPEADAEEAAPEAE
jgi:hypothetical protein